MNLQLPGGVGERGIVREFGMDMYTLKYLKWVTNKDLFVQHMELCPMLYGSLDRSGVWWRTQAVYVAESLFCSPETTTTLLTGYVPMKDKKFKRKNKD